MKMRKATKVMMTMAAMMAAVVTPAMADEQSLAQVVQDMPAADFGDRPDWPAYYSDEYGTYVYYDDEDAIFYYYDGRVGDYVILEDIEDDEDWYEPECQYETYGYAQVNSLAEFFDLNWNNIFAIPAGEYVLLLQPVGDGGDVTHVMYDDSEGYVYTSCLLPSDCDDLTYDEITQSDTGYRASILVDANLRDENGDVIGCIPGGSAVEVISDTINGRVWVRWNGRCGTVTAGALNSQTESSDNSSVVLAADDCQPQEVFTSYGTATIKTKVGANLRGSDNEVIVAIPQGEEVTLLQDLNYGGRTKVQWGSFVGSVLTRCLIEDETSATTQTSTCNCCKCNK
jgi:hypothetical protein